LRYVTVTSPSPLSTPGASSKVRPLRLPSVPSPPVLSKIVVSVPPAPPRRSEVSSESPRLVRLQLWVNVSPSSDSENRPPNAPPPAMLVAIQSTVSVAPLANDAVTRRRSAIMAPLTVNSLIEATPTEGEG